MSHRAKYFIFVPVLLASAVWLYFTFNPIPPAPDLHVHRALGTTVAQQASKAANGGRVIVFAPDITIFKSPAARAEIQAFYETAKAANLNIASTNLIKLDPLRPLRVPSGDFLAALRKYSEKDVIVSFMGPPLLTADQRQKLPQKWPKVVAACTGGASQQLPIRQMFESGLIHCAVISHPSAPGSAPAGGDVFARFYRVITAETLADLPAVSASVATKF